ncbi:Rne/Rng family ribonuclease [Marinitenerispora sediminis]|uniref:Ribonuclease E n=1 Tax=Marinitenerispora sediminis TaxID=1931232 RepID=A0A368T3P2_9ACTN|nr:Rne/Rng family ribonuclease [Marinitenerispora sediminis]RCV52937.1 ribonuclease E/G [Marinitenerispora sediminis]RCV53885.1 ribonuclease E/G [Marinitenerispora sediminis]RCV57048.1 ribonuclease E/G [Marinitenerispora sediminis]
MLENEPSSGAEGTAGRTTETTETAQADVTVRTGESASGAAKPARRRRSATRPAGPPPEPEPIAPAAAARTAPAAEAAVESVPAEGESAPEPERGAPAPRTRTRARRAKAAPPAAEAEPDAAEPAAGQEPEDTGAEQPSSGAAVAFQPPMVVFQPPVPQGPANGVHPVGPADTAQADTEEGAEADEEHTDDEDDDRPSRRRRRRGGRGRGRTRAGEEGDESDEPGQPAPAVAERAPRGRRAEAAEDEEPAADESGAAEEETDEGRLDDAAGTSRRRRRRRRRSGAEAPEESPEPDDPPNTVVRVREPRAAAPIEDEVQAVRGSTRLEAKKQRRREGREQGRRRAPIITESEFLARRESVKRDLVIRRTGERTQIAVLEDDVLVEHYVDRATHKSYVGNVYLGRVQNVLPSMEAAFVDIGKGRNAVLYAGEVNWDASGLEGQPKRIESALKSGQSVLVQVTKDPLGHKGARLTSQISLPGRYLVYVPDGTMTGISRKLPDKERARLKQILKKVMPEHAGVIVRTAAEGASEEELERDISRLAAQWESIRRKSKSATAPALLYSEPDLTVRVVRDVFNEDFASLVVSGDEAWRTVDEYVNYVAPHLAERLSHWSKDRDVFDAYRVDEQIAKALERKVWLPSGGSLVIDRTEAMTVVDVNTGKFTGQGGNLEETVTKNNLEAAEEIVRQLRLRDIGGIIVIDFIDMVLESNRDLVLRRMLECLSRDRTKHQVAEVTSLGLVQMTRKRVGQGLLEAFSTTCDCCNGRGLILSTEPVEARPANGGNGASGGGRKKKGKGGAAEKAEKAEKAAPEKPAAEAGKGEPEPAAPPAEQPEPAEQAPKAEKKTARKASRRVKREKAAAVDAPEEAPAAAAQDSGEPSAAPEPVAAEAAQPAAAPAPEAAESADAEAEPTESGTERPRRRRTRRTKTAAAAAETAVVEAGSTP